MVGPGPITSICAATVNLIAALDTKLQRYRLNLKHLTLPEIKDFNALGYRFCFREKAKCFKARSG